MIARIKRWYSRLRFARAAAPKWPCPTYKIDKEPHFLFIITPPFSGSTALAKILHSAPFSTFLQGRAEGQWLVPGMCESDRWDPAKTIHWKSVRSVWLKCIEQQIATSGQNVELIIEKSPPNLVRMDHLLKVFSNHSLLAFNRNPYAFASSTLYRRQDLDNISTDKRSEIVSSITNQWLFRSNWIKKWITEWQLTFFTYEQFCTEPAACVARLAASVPELQAVDVTTKIKVSKHELQGLVNFNPAQISRLRQTDIDVISATLAQDRALVAFFDYSIVG